MPRFIASLDQGTTSTRCLIIDSQGAVRSSESLEHHQIHPKPGWVEHDAMEIWDNSKRVVEKALNKAFLTAGDISALGITNQRETVVMWNRVTGLPLGPALVWQDTRTRGACHELSGDQGVDRFRAKTGLPLATYFSAPKIRWCLEHFDGASSEDVICGTIDSWLLWNWSGHQCHGTDCTNASRTMLMSLQTLDWDPELLDAFSIPRSILPKIYPSSHIFAEAVEALEGVPIGGILGDQQAALVGQGCFSVGDAKNTYGTGCFLLMNVGDKPVRSDKGLLSTVAYKFGDSPAAYALEGSVAVAGSLIQWLRDNLGIIQSAGEVEALASLASDNGGVYIVPAFSGLFAPHWRDDARGIIAGLTGFANRSHIARAALEACAFQTHDLVKVMEMESGRDLDVIKVDGGMAANNLLMQIQADIANKKVERSHQLESSALGAAFTAGLATGFWKTQDEIKSLSRLDRRFTPSLDSETRTARLDFWSKAVRRSIGWIE